MYFSLIIICVFCALYESQEYDTLRLVEDFEENPSLGRDLSIIMIAKDFTQMMRRKEWFDLKMKLRDNEPVQIGRFFTRASLRGVIMGFNLSDDRMLFDKAKWKKFHFHPSGLSFHSGKILIAGGVELEEIDLKDMNSRIIENKYFRDVHTAVYDKSGRKCLITSTGLDLLIEFDLETEKIVWEYCPWDYRLYKSNMGYIVTRDPVLSKKLKDSGTYHLFVDDPGNSQFKSNGVATGVRPCHLNGAFYYDDDHVGFTCAHRNISMLVRKKDNRFKYLTKDLHFPHSFQHQNSEIPCKGYVICDTKGSAVVFLDSNHTICLRLDVKNEFRVSDRDKRFGFEWTQMVSILDKDLYSVVDSSRKIVILVDMKKRHYRIIPHDDDLSIQEILLEPEEYKDLLLNYFNRNEKEEEEYETHSHVMSSNQDKEKYEKLFVKDRKKEINRIKSLERLEIKNEELEDLINIVNGKYFPLEGFMNSTEFSCVLEKKSLCDGTKLNVWKEDDSKRRPIILSSSDTWIQKIKVGDEIVLVDLKKEENEECFTEKIVGVMIVEEIFQHDPYYHSFMFFGKSLIAFEQERMDKGIPKTEMEPPIYMKRIFGVENHIVAGKIVSFFDVSS